jgi:hypothetical protein
MGITQSAFDPASRVRFIQYIPALERAGWRVSHRPNRPDRQWSSPLRNRVARAAHYRGGRLALALDGRQPIATAGVGTYIRPVFSCRMASAGSYLCRIAGAGLHLARRAAMPSRGRATAVALDRARRSRAPVSGFLGSPRRRSDRRSAPRIGTLP